MRQVDVFEDEEVVAAGVYRLFSYSFVSGMPDNVWVPNLKLQVIKLNLFCLKALISQLLIFRDESRISSHEEEFIINENESIGQNWNSILPMHLHNLYLPFICDN